jgi:hypothetical protein
LGRKIADLLIELRDGGLRKHTRAVLNGRLRGKGWAIAQHRDGQEGKHSQEDFGVHVGPPSPNIPPDAEVFHRLTERAMTPPATLKAKTMMKAQMKAFFHISRRERRARVS